MKSKKKDQKKRNELILGKNSAVVVCNDLKQKQ